MLSLLLVLASLGQCPSGQCSVAQPAYSMPRYFYAPPVQPTLWQLADRENRVWQHTDPAYLRAWIAHRNGLVLTAPVGGK